MIQLIRRFDFTATTGTDRRMNHTKLRPLRQPLLRFVPESRIFVDHAWRRLPLPIDDGLHIGRERKIECPVMRESGYSLLTDVDFGPAFVSSVIGGQRLHLKDASQAT